MKSFLKATIITAALAASAVSAQAGNEEFFLRTNTIIPGQFAVNGERLVEVHDQVKGTVALHQIANEAPVVHYGPIDWPTKGEGHQNGKQ